MHFFLVLEETLTMEEIMLRFSHLGESIFDQLDNASFAKCRIVNQAWKSFLETEQLPFRIIRNEPGLHQKKHVQIKGKQKEDQNTVLLAPSNKFLKKILRENPEDTPMDLANKINECFLLGGKVSHCFTE